MDRTDLPAAKSSTELLSRAARARRLALTVMDELTISRLEELARDYEAEAAVVERGESRQSK